MKLFIIGLLLSTMASAQDKMIPGKGPNFFSAGSVGITIQDFMTDTGPEKPHPLFQIAVNGRYSFPYQEGFSTPLIDMIAVYANDIESKLYEEKDSISSASWNGKMELSPSWLRIILTSSMSEVKISCKNRKPIITTQSSSSKVACDIGPAYFEFEPTGKENETFTANPYPEEEYKFVFNEIKKDIKGNKADVSVNALSVYKVLEDGTEELLSRASHSRAYAECNQ